MKEEEDIEFYMNEFFSVLFFCKKNIDGSYGIRYRNEEIIIYNI